MSVWIKAVYACLTCGRQYEPRRKDQKYCSKACLVPAQRLVALRWWREHRGKGHWRRDVVLPPKVRCKS
jgi:hypothetical protein